MRATRSSGRPGGSQLGTLREHTPLGPGTPSGADPPEQTPRYQAPPPLTESQMPVKTLPYPSFVAGGNNFSSGG